MAKEAPTLIKVCLTDEELQLTAIDELLNMYTDWLTKSKESAGGRKTRAANRKAENIYEDIMAFKLPPIKIQTNATVPPEPQAAVNNNHCSAKSSIDNSEASSLTSSESRGRTLRPRSRTPSGSKNSHAVPSTPTQQSIRAAMKKNPDSANSANVLSAALNQQHPSVSVTKIRQLLRADSAQKRREEELERSEQARLQRKAKEERAEAQKKQLLEERAITAKLRREQRLLHAAEVRKAREKTKTEQKLKEVQQKTKEPSLNASQTIKKKDSEVRIVKEVPQIKPKEPVELKEPSKQTNKANETFQKVPDGQNNIDISICDETTDEKRKNPQPIAAWAKVPGLRDAIVTQFSKPEADIQQKAMSIFGGVKLPVALVEIFGKEQAVNSRYYSRTSSAVWSTPARPSKRTSSDVLTPNEPKRHL